MSLDGCHHHVVDEKEYLRDCHRIAYGRCPACQQKVCLEHLSEHHRIEIEPHFDILIDRANQTRARLEMMSAEGTKQRAQQFVEAWKRRTIASIERAASDKMMEIDSACVELIAEMKHFKTATLEKFKSNMLLSSPHIHRDYVHPDELSRLEELLTLINSHIDRYVKHELLEDNSVSNIPSITSHSEDNRASTFVLYSEQFYHQ